MLGRDCNNNDTYREEENNVVSQPPLSPSQMPSTSQLVDDEKRGAGENSDKAHLDDESSVLKSTSVENSDRGQLLDSVDYAIILSYLEIFGENLFPGASVSIRMLEENLLEKSEKVSRKYRDFHLRLIRSLRTGRSVRKQKWEPFLVRFADEADGELSDRIADELKEKGYSSLSTGMRLRIIKNLFEAQFDENMKFRQLLDDESRNCDEFRAKPIGTDQNGLVYWFFSIDSNHSFRLFTEYDNRWKIIAKDQNELKKVINELLNSASETTSGNGSNQNDQSTTTTRPRRNSNRQLKTTPSPESPQSLSSASGCQKCSKKSGKMLKCDECCKCYHKSCTKIVSGETTSGAIAQGRRTPKHQWVCPTCEQSQLIKLLELKLKEIDSNSQRTVLSTADLVTSESEAAYSDEEAVIDDEPQPSSLVGADESSLEKSKKKSLINFDSPVKEGQKRSCRMNNVKYQFDDDEEPMTEKAARNANNQDTQTDTSDDDWIQEILETDEDDDEKMKEKQKQQQQQLHQHKTINVDEMLHNRLLINESPEDDKSTSSSSSYASSSSSMSSSKPRKFLIKRPTSEDIRQRRRRLEERRKYEFEFGYKEYNEDDYFRMCQAMADEEDKLCSSNNLV